MNDNNYHLNKAFFRHPLIYDGLQLLQIGRMFCKSTTVIDTHVHMDCYELTVVTDGQGLISTNGIPTQVKKGDIYVSLPCDAHKIEADSQNPLKFDFFAFYSLLFNFSKFSLIYCCKRAIHLS
jgi:quercetin dioxygenase-like cupin family protein